MNDGEGSPLAVVFLPRGLVSESADGPTRHPAPRRRGTHFRGDRLFSMANNDLHSRWGSVAGVWAAVLLAGGTVTHCFAQAPAPELEVPRQKQVQQLTQELKNTQENRNAEKRKHHPADITARKRMGKASFYAPMFAGRKMANGNKMDPHGNNAASKTLPLGTTAKVTNLETGKSAVVIIQDRGPYVPGRIVDLSPATAKQIGITPRQGVAMVVVAPIAVPQPDGAVKLGAAASEPIEQTTVTTAMRGASVFREASAADERTALR
jgi:rare lipoprotein A